MYKYHLSMTVKEETSLSNDSLFLYTRYVTDSSLARRPCVLIRLSMAILSSYMQVPGGYAYVKLGYCPFVPQYFEVIICQLLYHSC